MPIFDEADLAILRRAYALQVVAAADVSDPRLVAALAEVHREDFLPEGPWPLHPLANGGKATPDADPLYLYQDLAVPILPDKGLNNGAPSFATRLIAAAGIRDGDRVVHVGTGTGYYTALMARLAGPGGRVLGVEIEPQLARRASELLASYPTVRILEGNGRRQELEAADVVIVNAGTSSLSPRWLDALPLGGRLVVPLAARDEAGRWEMTRGIVLRLERDADGFAVSFVSWVAIYPCLGGDDPEADTRLRAALEAGGARDVTRLVRRQAPVDGSCWFAGDGWYLA